MEGTTTSGAVAGNGGASPEGNQPTKPESQATHERAVPWSDHRRAIDDMHEYKTRAKQLEADIAASNEERLKEKEQYKELAEINKKEAEKWKSEAEKGNSLFEQTQKHAAVTKEAVEAGILPEALGDLDLVELDSLKIETTNQGRFAVHGAKEFVADLKNNKPHWFKVAEGPNVDSGGGGTPPGEPAPKTAADVLKAEREWKYGKITREEYEKVFTEYSSHKAAK